MRINSNPSKADIVINNKAEWNAAISTKWTCQGGNKPTKRRKDTQQQTQQTQQSQTQHNQQPKPTPAQPESNNREEREREEDQNSANPTTVTFNSGIGTLPTQVEENGATQPQPNPSQKRVAPMDWQISPEKRVRKDAMIPPSTPNVRLMVNRYETTHTPTNTTQPTQQPIHSQTGALPQRTPRTRLQHRARPKTTFSTVPGSGNIPAQRIGTESMVAQTSVQQV